MKKSDAYFLGSVVLILILCTGIFRYIVSNKKNNTLTVTFLDVGQGDAIYVRSPSGVEMLIDGGRDKKVLQKLSKEMGFFDKHIDIVVATHPDLDHIGGLPEVLDRYTIDMYIGTGVPGSSGAQDELVSKIIRKRLHGELVAVEAFVGQTIDLGGGVTAKILHPVSTKKEYDDTNSSSIIILLTYNKTSFLLTGDAPKEVEHLILDLLPNDITVLKPGHHGSNTSTSFELLEKITPEIAVISSGKNNSYGHPHQEVIDLLEKHHVNVYRTDTRGSVRLVSDGEKVALQK